MQIRQKLLILAESLDALRVVPRTMIVAYGWIVVQLYIWFRSIPTYVQEKCDPAVLLLAINKNMALIDAKALACTVVDVVGGPTPSQTAFVTTIIGLSTAIFGLYANSGRRWEGWNPNRATNPRFDNEYNQQYNQYGPDDQYGPPPPKTQINVFGNKTEQEVAPVPQGPTPIVPVAPSPAAPQPPDNVIRVPDEDTPPRP